MQWQLIKTAPRDAVILLGYEPHPRMLGVRRVYEGRWDDNQRTWTSVNGFLVHNLATSWMPMPEPPETRIEMSTAGNAKSVPS